MTSLQQDDPHHIEMNDINVQEGPNGPRVDIEADMNEQEQSNVDENGRRKVPVPLSPREKRYGIWFIFKSWVSITLLVICMIAKEKQIANFYNSHAICDICYADSTLAPETLFEFNICGNDFNEVISTPNSTTTALRYEYQYNLLWTLGGSNETGAIIIAVIDWIVIMYFSITSVSHIREAITQGNAEDLENAKRYLIHNALFCHMIVFSIANSLWYLMKGQNGCYVSHLAYGFAQADAVIAFFYIIVFLASSCCMGKHKGAAWLHVFALMMYAGYSLVAAMATLLNTGNWHHFAFVLIVFVCIFDIPLFFHNQSAVRGYLGYSELGLPDDDDDMVWEEQDVAQDEQDRKETISRQQSINDEPELR